MVYGRRSFALLLVSTAACFNPSGNDTTSATATTADATTGSTTSTSDPTTTSTSGPTTGSTTAGPTADPTTDDPGTTTGTTGTSTDTTGASAACGDFLPAPGEVCFRSIGVADDVATPSDVVIGDFVAPHPQLEVLAIGPIQPTGGRFTVVAGALEFTEALVLTVATTVLPFSQNGDAATDLVLAGIDGFAFEIMVNTAGKVLWQPESKPITAGASAKFAAAGRIRGPGENDVVAGDVGVGIWLDPYTAMPLDADQGLLVEQPRAGGLGRFDPDDRPDLAILAADGQLVSVYPAQAEPMQPFSTGAQDFPFAAGRALLFADLDGNGQDELIVAGHGGDANCKVFTPMGEQQAFACGSMPLDLAFAPVNGGALLFVADAAGEVLVFRHGGDGLAPVASVKPLQAPHAIAVGDLDGEGRVDFAVACPDHIEVFLASD